MSLNAFYEDHLVGTLNRDDELVYSFTYAEAWLQNPKRFPLSLAMPLDKKQFGNKITLSFFENLLPEGEVMKNLQQVHGVSGMFDFLKTFGRDCAGAIIVTEQSAHVHTNDPSQTVLIDMDKVYSAIDERRSVADIIASMNPGYLSLAGAQDKFPAIFLDNNFYLPTQNAPTTHIVKVPIQHSGIKESVYNEYFCMELARKVGFTVPHCVISSGTHPLFVVERYDRIKDARGVIHRIHQQDFCQAQGITSEFKYEDKGGPTLKQNYQLIQNNVNRARIVNNLQIFMDWLAFNLIIGNNDSHSKNISFLLQNGCNELAPLYDLICTAIYPKLKRRFSFKIGERDEFSKIGANQFAELERDLELRKETFQKRVARIAAKVRAAKDPLAKEMADAFPQAKIPKRISELIDKRLRSLERHDF